MLNTDWKVLPFGEKESRLTHEHKIEERLKEWLAHKRRQTDVLEKQTREEHKDPQRIIVNVALIECGVWMRSSCGCRRNRGRLPVQSASEQRPFPGPAIVAPSGVMTANESGDA